MIKLKNIIISEFIEDFDMDYFKSLSNFSKRIRYCTDKLKKLTSGSSRIIFQIDEKRVLKLAKNQKGIAQNQVESDWVLNKSYGNVIAKVLESDNDDKWVVSEYAKKIGTNRFKQLTGIEFNVWRQYLFGRFVNNKVEVSEQDSEKIENEDGFFYDVLDMIMNFDMPHSDFERINSYGEIDGRIVVTDYGLNRDVFNTYYKRNKF